MTVQEEILIPTGAVGFGIYNVPALGPRGRAYAVKGGFAAEVQSSLSSAYMQAQNKYELAGFIYALLLLEPASWPDRIRFRRYAGNYWWPVVGRTFKIETYAPGDSWVKNLWQVRYQGFVAYPQKMQYLRDFLSALRDTAQRDTLTS